MDPLVSNLFRRAFEQVNGSGSCAAPLDSVPTRDESAIWRILAPILVAVVAAVVVCIWAARKRHRIIENPQGTGELWGKRPLHWTESRSGRLSKSSSRSPAEKPPEAALPPHPELPVDTPPSPPPPDPDPYFFPL